MIGANALIVINNINKEGFNVIAFIITIAVSLIVIALLWLYVWYQERKERKNIITRSNNYKNK